MADRPHIAFMYPDPESVDREEQEESDAASDEAGEWWVKHEQSERLDG